MTLEIGNFFRSRNLKKKFFNFFQIKKMKNFRIFFFIFSIIIFCLIIKNFRSSVPKNFSTSDEKKKLIWHQIPGKRILISPYAYEDYSQDHKRIKLLALKHKNESINNYHCFIHTNESNSGIFLGEGKDDLLNFDGDSTSTSTSASNSASNSASISISASISTSVYKIWFIYCPLPLN